MAVGLVTAAGSAAADEGRLAVELNKFEDVETGCRSFFLFRNRTTDPLEAFEMSLAILTSDGIIDRLLTIDAAPLPSGRTTLKLFEIPEIQCSAIGEVLLHDIAACRPQNGEEMDCFAILELGSKTAAPLVQ
ncbi:MAG: hypothetical protein AAGC57_10135 [Pseudomonadota bacterium]